MKPFDDFLDLNQADCCIIAEVAQTHDGSLGLAHAFIDAIADSGADAVKFQTHIAAAESTRHEPFRVKFSRQDDNRFDYWRRLEFTPAQWQGLADHAQDRGLYFLSSPFSLEAVDLLEQVGVPAWKVGSGEVVNLPMLQHMAATGKPILLSSGMSSWQELDDVVGFLRGLGAPFALMQATTMYPTPADQIGLNLLAEYRQRFDCPVGLSDHSGTIYPGLAAYTLGARFLEVHVTLSRYMFGPDVGSSVTLEDLTSLVRGVRFLQQTLSHPINKDEMAQQLQPLKQIFQKSVVPRVDLPAGTILRAEHLALKKPGTGIPAHLRDSLVGRRLRRDVAADDLISLDDLDE